MRVAILQSNYIPWKGYFDIIHDVDLFVFYDDLQYTTRDWRNRNRIKTPKGLEWLTIPVGARKDRLICKVEIPDRRWARKHWRTIGQYYARAKHFKRYAPFFEEVYCCTEWRNLSVLNQYLIKRIATDLLGIQTVFRDSREFEPQGVKQERLLDLLRKAGATQYVSGPAAKDYIEPERFRDAGIELAWKDYAGYPEYPQFFPPFTHQVTVLDLLFHVGADAPYYIWGWREGTSPAPEP